MTPHEIIREQLEILGMPDPITHDIAIKQYTTQWAASGRVAQLSVEIMAWQSLADKYANTKLMDVLDSLQIRADLITTFRIVKFLVHEFTEKGLHQWPDQPRLKEMSDLADSFESLKEEDGEDGNETEAG